MDNNIFKEYYTPREFIDRFTQNEIGALDVIIPVYHTNDLWKTNLYSIYREVPVRRLLISDGGCIDDSIDVVKDFPRVEILNHTNYKSLGKCIAELIKAVDSDWFIYLHSDVYLPQDWFDTMIKYQEDYDWYGCPMNVTALINYRLNEPRRPYAGSQMGKKQAFVEGINAIDDDYVYRQEDFVFNKIVEDAGYKTGKVEDTFHYHQNMYRKSKGYTLEVTRLNVQTNTSQEELDRQRNTQLRGIVKYLDPVEPYILDEFRAFFRQSCYMDDFKYFQFRKWVKETNLRWLPHISFGKYISIQLRKSLGGIKRRILS